MYSLKKISMFYGTVHDNTYIPIIHTYRPIYIPSQVVVALIRIDVCGDARERAVDKLDCKSAM